MTLGRAPARLLVAAFWSVFGAIAGLQIWLSMLAHHHSWAMIIGYQVITWDIWIVYTIAIGALVARAPVLPPRWGAVLLHLGTALVFGVAHVALWVGVELWLKPYDFMNPRAFGPRFSAMLVYQLPLELLVYALVALAFHTATAYARARERELRAAQLETSLAEARLSALELQIQPHFLFNTLNGIGALVRAGQNKEALGMLGGLSDLLRYALDRGGGQRVTLDDERGMLDSYLAIQRLRFGDRLDYAIDVSPEAGRAVVPVLLLQPLAENGIRHGIAPSDAPGRLHITGARQGDTLVVEVFNTGRLAEGARRGIGLSSTAARLAALFGERARLDLLAVEGGVLARVTLPWSVAP